MGLTLVDLHTVAAEEVVVDLHDAHVSIQRNFYHVVTAVSIALQRIHRLLVVQLDGALQLTARHVEGGVSTYLEVNLLVVRILHVPDDVHLVAFQSVADGQIEAEGVHLQRLF